MKRTLLALAICGLLALLGPTASARKWTSTNGRFSLEADLVDYADGNVTLQKSDGDTVTLAASKLCDADRRYLALAKKKGIGPKKADVSYARDVQPFLANYCAQCHNHNKAKAGYNVEGYAAITGAGRRPLVVPGKPAESRLIAVLQGNGKRMPPGRSQQPTQGEVAKLVAWIEAGAPDDSSDAGPQKARRKGAGG